MIEKIKQEDLANVVEFLQYYNIYNDIYITKNNERIYLEKDIDNLMQTLKTQECYTLNNEGYHGLFIIIREKGYRNYLKIVADSEKAATDLLLYLDWNFNDELYAKLKRRNPFVYILQNFGFKIVAERNRELLLYRPKKIIEVK
ncbi:MAG: hypothetical protein WC169_12380 [Dehalococcoidia bacterium]|jgi:hypothetical protein